MAILEAVDGASLDRLEQIVVYGENVDTSRLFHGKGVLAYQSLRERPPYHGDHGGGSVASNIFTTSGTTKAPKFVLHDHSNVVSHARNVARNFGYDAPDSVILQSLPLCGVFGFSQAMACLAAGRPMVMQATFEAEPAADLIIEHRVTAFNGSDEMMARLLAARSEAVPFPSIRFCGFAAFNPTMDAIVAQAQERGLRLVGLYGASEVQALFARQDPASPAAIRGRPGGFPVGADYAVRVRDPDTGAERPPGRSGELELKGPSAMAGYFGDDAATARAVTADGWLRSGDLGRVLDDGSFIFETRMGDVLRLGGYLVAPAEIEAHIQRHPTIEACQIVGVPGAGGLLSIAFVTLRAGTNFDEAGLRRFCAEGLARFKVPARIFALGTFPMTASANGSKVQRAKLRAMAEAWLATSEAAGGD
jgi:fatty-acyl-CoA synthase